MYSKQKRENLDIIFRRTPPRLILKEITGYISGLKKPDMSVRLDRYSAKAYDYFGQLNLSNYSLDETQVRFKAMKNEIDSYGTDYIFGMLNAYADEVLDIVDGTIVCKMNEILNWNSICSRLGQDVFTTAWVAKYDSEKPVNGKHKFDWYSILKTDDFKLNNILKNGVAENHFHLHGSTQSFSLSWVFIMNYPEKIREIFEGNSKLNTRYVVNVSENIDNNVISRTEVLMYAAYIRALLFCRCVGQNSQQRDEEEYEKFDKMDFLVKEDRTRELVKQLRYIYGCSFKQMTGQKKCLDYAICKELYCVDPDLSLRLLCGERSFLYHCFRMVYENKMSMIELMMLHAYLVIKNNFRGEIIQINNRTGFKNFSQYQDRKNEIFGNNREYWAESLRLSVVNAFNENNLKALEARIMPRESPDRMRREILQMDKLIKDGGLKEMSGFSYITHFAKSSIVNDDISLKDTILLPRNHKVRERVEKQAKALKGYFAERYAKNWDDYLEDNGTKNKSRICGIDACSNEIGCRPEVFATAFRYLRKLDVKPYIFQKNSLLQTININITYHAGEDFLDICDGIRAIDEAINFLNMKKGDRLGHALALGIDSKDYYTFKKLEVYMPKQDLLDNCVWLLYRSLKWNIEIDSNNREVLKQRAKELIQEIFDLDNVQDREGDGLRKEYGNILQLYYYSWMLRGDAPELYRSGEYREVSGNVIPDDYTEYMCNGENLKMYRNNKYVTWFYYMYHYDKGVEERGLKPEGFHVENWYIDLIDKFQEHLMQDIAERGISIECNPTSNILISSFSQYDRHPITRFNNFYLNSGSEKAQLEVSINTDDLGVFDTSIENEYALLLNAFCRQRHREGNYNDEQVYAYFEHVRKKSLQMSFIQTMEKEEV